MVKLFIYTIVVIVAALFVTLYLGIGNDPGYLLIAWRNYTFETSIFALVVLFVVVVILLRLILLVVSWVNPWQLVRYSRHYRQRRQSKASGKTAEGLMHFVRGNWQSAYNLLSKSYGDNDATVINYLAAAYAAFSMNQNELWAKCLDAAASKYPASLSTINSLRAELLFRSDHLEQSLALLEQLKKTSINDKHLLGLLKEVYVKLEDWKSLEALLPALETDHVIDADEIDRIEKRLFVEKLNECVEQMDKDKSARQKHLAELQKKWRKAPNRFRDDEKLVSYYSELLIKVAATSEAARAIETFLDKSWSDTLIEKYGRVDFSDEAQQLVHGENWLKGRPNNSQLLLALGRICMRNQLWGKAREYFETSLGISATAQVYGELGRLVRGLGEIEASEAYFVGYVEQIGDGLPELPLPVDLDKKASHIEPE